MLSPRPFQNYVSFRIISKSPFFPDFSTKRLQRNCKHQPISLLTISALSPRSPEWQPNCRFKKGFSPKFAVARMTEYPLPDVIMLWIACGIDGTASTSSFLFSIVCLWFEWKQRMHFFIFAGELINSPQNVWHMCSHNNDFGPFL